MRGRSYWVCWPVSGIGLESTIAAWNGRESGDRAAGIAGGCVEYLAAMPSLMARGLNHTADKRPTSRIGRMNPG